jgi:hypothetical protein
MYLPSLPDATTMQTGMAHVFAVNARPSIPRKRLGRHPPLSARPIRN